MTLKAIIKTAIDGLTFTPRQIIPDAKGAVLHCLKAAETDLPIGEVYFSEVKAGMVKGWKRHAEMWQRYTVPSGHLKFVFFDSREESPTMGKIVELETGPESDGYGLITVPPRIWYSFKATGPADALIVNCASIPHRQGESESMPLADFKWHSWPA